MRLLAALLMLTLPALAAERPNIIFVLCDNLGNGDVHCFNPETRHRTPNLDGMAAEGTRFTSYYSASGVCTPSRAALMTGCYPRRIDMHVSATGGGVLQPVAAKGLNPSETTLAEVLKPSGYHTMIIGKWHLGDQPEFLPTRQGFDSYFGIPYSDDMTKDKRPDSWPELPLMRDEKVIEAPVDRDLLTRRYTEEAIRYIEANREHPFFLYLPHAMPGSTKDPYASPAFKDKSANGHWGDSVEELDWSMGEILAALKRLNLDDRTLVIWTSDNGAPRRDPPQGTNAPYQGWGYNTSEGSMRMPMIARWPGKVPAGKECRELCSMLDILPTLAALTGSPLPKQTIDGHDIRPLLFGTPDAKSPTDERGFFYYQIHQLQAVRSGPWKLYLPLEKKRAELVNKRAATPLRLFNVRDDIGETQEVSAGNPEVVARLMKLAEAARAELGDEEKTGSGQRTAGLVQTPTARKLE
ncbi:sulfatase family protein [Brevifollis gellanilyticus]|uniref:Arylsulfatase n=1 Tax=Brevifollis gellanilyticus TaxID=748831 RepID=A0A512MCS4_9BACT|nr:sulfatase [Brevifollis gellanilyticus]GEP44544.1 arylsulfatase [Brevifollis gellanilyticus]